MHVLGLNSSSLRSNHATCRIPHIKSIYRLSRQILRQGMPGFELGQKITGKCGMRASMTAELVFNGVEVCIIIIAFFLPLQFYLLCLKYRGRWLSSMLLRLKCNSQLCATLNCCVVHSCANVLVCFSVASMSRRNLRCFLAVHIDGYIDGYGCAIGGP